MNKNDISDIVNSAKGINLLYVEDCEETRQNTALMLEEFFPHLVTAENGLDALEKLKEHTIDLIISDINMPELNGLDLLKTMRDSGIDTPLIFLSAYDDTNLYRNAIELGVDSFILKPINFKQITHTIGNAIEKILLRRESEHYYETLEEKIKERTKELSYELNYDSLTGLFSRHTFFKDLHETPKMLFIIDIEKFKIINEVYGNNIGSIVLQRFAHFIQGMIKDTTLKAYRLSGDEFAVVSFDSYANESNYKEHLKNFFEKMRSFQINIDDISIELDVKVGISTAEQNIFETAKMALDHAKETQTDYVLFSDAIDTRNELSELMILRKHLLDTIDKDNVIAVYQPIVDENNNTIKHEALMRIKHSVDDTLLSPYLFLEASIKLGLYKHLSSSIIFQSLEVIKKTQQTISINVAYNDIKNKALLDNIFAYLQENESIGKHLVLEITEDQNIENYNEVKNFIKRFKAFDCKVAIDDFGTGFSNFQHILEIKPDYIKIDGSLIKDIDTNESSYTLVEAIVKFSHKLGIKVIAEFVHSENIFDLLKKLDVDEYQGFYFSPPISKQEVLKDI